jgi:hypothetical protein
MCCFAEFMNVSLTILGDLPVISISSAYARIWIDLVYMVLLLSIHDFHMAHSSAVLNSMHARVSPCLSPCQVIHFVV